MKKTLLVCLLIACALVAVMLFSVAYFYHPNQFKFGPVIYYLGNEKYEIPTKFNPINGSSKPGGTRIVIHVSYPSLKGEYDDPDYTKHELALSKSTDTKPLSDSLDEQCSDITFCSIGDAGNASFKRDGFTYDIHYQGHAIKFTSKEELSAFENSIISLFNSFK